ncbi:MAG: MFS transporter [Beduini sp.]|uniref:MFS transporter n=1 Tax=Beduini sp. TaxID=1922300 RepID=UPI003990CDAC
MKKQIWNYAWVILLAVSLIRGVAGAGINTSAGIFLAPVSRDLDVGVGRLSLYLSIASIANLLWLPIAGDLINKMKIKRIIVLSTLLQVIPFLCLGYMNSVWAWYIFAVPMAIGATFLVNLLGPILINRWFHKNIGLVMGLMMMISSLMGAVFQPMLTGLIAANGWRSTYVLFGLFALIFILVVGLVFIKENPAYQKSQQANSKKTTKTTDNNKKNKNILSKVILKSPAFYLLLLFMVILTGFASFQQHATNFGIAMGLDITIIGKALSLSMMGSAIGSVLIGISSDKIGIIKTCAGIITIAFISIILYRFVNGSILIFAFASFLHGLASSSISVVGPLLTIEFFGQKDYPTIFPFVMTSLPLATIILLPAYGFIYDYFGNYNPVFIFLLGAVIISVFCLLIGYRSSRRSMIKN